VFVAVGLRMGRGALPLGSARDARRRQHQGFQIGDVWWAGDWGGTMSANESACTLYESRIMNGENSMFGLKGW